jgi:hypothetical protein
VNKAVQSYNANPHPDNIKFLQELIEGGPEDLVRLLQEQALGRLAKQ